MNAAEKQLLENVKSRSSELEDLISKLIHTYNEAFYRFYHQSFKVYNLQKHTLKIRDVLQSLLPDQKLNDWFEQIVLEGTDKQFDLSHNREWFTHARPILDAFNHAFTFLKLTLKVGMKYIEPPQILSSEYAAVLYLYGLRHA